ncbi:MAG: FAD-binding domain-containing protein [Pseudomonadota bacterium]
MTEFLPSRQAGLERLDAFLPRAGRRYQRDRNFDLGPDRRDNVSCLSPWLSHRLLSDWEVVQTAVDHHGLDAAEKFVDEVMWRSYWRGWLEQHRQVWDDYQAALSAPLPTALEKALGRATAGQTGIDCFDAWADELIRYGYLHNHARMWFASIWVFTLKLPWERGADWFLRHLVDGDAASNTLSWRWVAGLQTVGKTYLAREDNIRRFTEGRFSETPGLTQSAGELPDVESPALNAVVHQRDVIDGRAVFLITETDLFRPELDAGCEIAAVGSLSLRRFKSDRPLGDVADSFSAGALSDATARLNDRFGVGESSSLVDVSEVAAFARDHGVASVVMSRCPVGPGRAQIDELANRLADAGIRFKEISRRWDEVCWPYCKKGFFQFRRRIPEIVADLSQFPGA